MLYNAYYTIYIINYHCIVCSVHYVVDNTIRNSAVCNKVYLMHYTVHNTIYIIPYVPQYMLYIYTIYNIQRIVYLVLYIIHYTGKQ